MNASDDAVDGAVDVAIVGCGPTGATLANLCGLSGLRTVVFEQSSVPFSFPRACHIDGEVARVWQACGLAEQIAPLLTTSAGMEYVDGHGRHLFSFEGFDRQPLMGWEEDYVFNQSETDRVLRHGLDRFPHVQVKLGTPSPGLPELLDMARFVVGCDGASSAIRDQLGMALIDRGYDEPWLVIDVMLTEGSAGGAAPLPLVIQQVCDERRLATFVPGHGRHRRWEFRLAEGEAPPDPWELLAPWGVTAATAEIIRSAAYRFHALVADRWRGGPDDRVLLAGDAAHQMPPFMGQGLCSGVRDAAALAWRFADRNTADRLATYEAERRQHVEAVIDLSVEAGRTLARLAADPTDLPRAAQHDPQRWSRLPGLDLGGDFPIGHLLAQPGRFDDDLPIGWCWLTSDPGWQPDATIASAAVEIVVDQRADAASYGNRAVLVRPDRYIADVVR